MQALDRMRTTSIAMEQHGRATATGEQIHTSVERTPGGVRASSSSRSTGTGAPQQHEETVLHARAGEQVVSGRFDETLPRDLTCTARPQHLLLHPLLQAKTSLPP